MGLTTAPILQIVSVSRVNADNKCGAMSQGFHQNIFSFSDGFDRQTTTASQEETHHHHQQVHQQQQQHHIAQQSRRDKMRVQQGFEPPGHSLPSIDHGEDDDQAAGIYEGAAGPTGNMLSDMFNFNAGAGPSATDLLASQIQGGYRLASRPLGPMVGFNGDWYNSQQRQGIVLGAGSSNIGPIGDAKQLSADSAAAAMQLFLMNPQQQQAQQHPTARSPSPPHPPSRQAQAIHHSFQAGHYGHGVAAAAAAVASFSGGVVEGQGLSLSLSSSLQQFEMAKAEQDLRVREGVLYFNNTSNTPQQHPLPPNTGPSMQLQGQGQQSQGHGQNVQMGYGPGPGPGPGPVGVVNVLRNSRYSRAAQELLEEFCSVGRGQFKGSRIGRHHHASTSSNPNPSNAAAAAASTSVAGSSSTSKDVPALSPADRFEHQRKKSKLLSMLDEVDRRYNHYCDQMQMVVNSFDSVMGFGAATPYTALAQKAMSRHFRCLKDAIAAQLKRTCELLGEKEAGAGSGITKGETPRLRLLDQSLRQQRAFHQMGMMEQEAWRPQRGLPERSVNILRAWLFEHFLHPYPSDADKHLLARQTGLSRNQVSNWFINARVRLWKPMVEEMYQQESKDEEPAGSSQRDDGNHHTLSQSQSPSQQQQQQPQHHHQPQQLHNLEADMPTQRFPSDSSSLHGRHHSVSSASAAGGGSSDPTGLMLPVIDPSDDLCGPHDDDIYREYGAAGLGPATRMRLGTAGDVSLTLGLRHAGNAPEKNRFSVRDYGGC